MFPSACSFILLVFTNGKRTHPKDGKQAEGDHVKKRQRKKATKSNEAESFEHMKINILYT
jgi:hypothetical protein